MADPTKPSTAPKVTGGAPPFQIAPIREVRKFVKCVFYGPFGSGKTTLAGTAVDVAEMRDVLYISAEGGTMSVEESDDIKNADLIDVVRVTDFNQVAHVQEFLKVHCAARDAFTRPNVDQKTKDAALSKLASSQSKLFGSDVMPIDVIDDEYTADERDEDGRWVKARLRLYRTVVIDSLTEIDTFSMYQLLNIKTDMKLDIDSMEVAQFAEFRKNNQMMQLLVRAYRDLDMNVLLICSTQYNQDELKRFHWVPSLTGKLAAQVQGFVDIVGFLQVGKQQEGQKSAPRRLYIQPVGQFDAKNRVASYKDPFIDSPTMATIMSIFRGKLK